jgi:protein-S-isoprenylcysteine O-methyltransferase Ste14
VNLFLKNLLFTIFVPGTVAVYVPLIIIHGRGITSSPLVLWVGGILLIAGAVIYLCTLWDFVMTGRSTPLPLDAPKVLVVKGLYRYTRNPMYIGVIAMILGWASVFADEWLLIYALAVGIIVHLFVVLYEEPKLLEQFGVNYEAYQRSVGRWLPLGPKRR